MTEATRRCGLRHGAIDVLTRPGCATTAVMHERLLAAALRLDVVLPCALVDITTLAADDVRRGYPTPTVLVNGVDLFGLEAPASRPAPT